MLENKIDYIVNNLGVKNFRLLVHPYVYAYLNSGLIPLSFKWKFKYSFGMKMIPSQALAFLQYEFHDKDGRIIDMKENVETI